MTIGIEATKAYEKEKTGVGWYTFYLIQELAELIQPPHKLRLYINPNAIFNFQFSIFKQIPNLNDKNQHYSIKALKWPPRILWTQLRLSLEMIKNSPDALFIPSHLAPPIHPKKLVITIHDLAFKANPDVYSKQELLMQEFGMRLALQSAWRIIVPSQFTKDEIYRWYPRYKKDNISVVPHGVDHTVFKTQMSDAKRQNHNSKIKNILYVGRLESKKNIVNLIKAFNILCSRFHISCYMTLIGPPGYGYKRIKKEIDASPYKNSITQTGWLDREETAKQMLNAAVFVFPSLYEGFGLPILESFAAGTPVACSDIPALKEVGNGLPLYFDPHNPENIAEKLAALLTDETLQKQKIAQGLSYAQSWRWQTSAKKTLEVLMG